MSNHDFTLTPRDLLFMHDARPMEASDAGQGANWPRPDQLWNAVINMFHRQWREMQAWEGDLHTQNQYDKHADSSFRFGALQTIGPFPMKEEKGNKKIKEQILEQIFYKDMIFECTLFKNFYLKGINPENHESYSAETFNFYI